MRWLLDTNNIIRFMDFVVYILQQKRKYLDSVKVDKFRHCDQYHLKIFEKSLKSFSRKTFPNHGFQIFITVLELNV